LKFHPVHIAVVHFPIALLSADMVFGIMGVYFNNDTFFRCGYYCLLGGVALGWLAILTGIVDLFLRILKYGAQATRKAWMHGGIQSAVVCGFTVLASLEYKNPMFATAPPTWLWTFKIFMLTLLFVGNYLGGELLLKYVARDFKDDNSTQ
jgi:uncharacterized membrane protein